MFFIQPPNYRMPGEEPGRRGRDKADRLGAWEWVFWIVLVGLIVLGFMGIR